MTGRRRLNPPPPEIAEPLTQAFGKRAPYVFDEVMKVLYPTEDYSDLQHAGGIDHVNEHLGAIYEIAFFTPSMRKNKKSPYLQTVVQWYTLGAINWDRPWEDVPQNLELLKEFHSRVQSGDIKGEAAKPKRYETPGEMIAVLDTGITSSQLDCAGADLRGEIVLDPENKTQLGPRVVRLWKVDDYDTFMRCKGDWKVGWCLTQEGFFDQYSRNGSVYLLTIQDNDIDRPEAAISTDSHTPGRNEYKDRGNQKIPGNTYNNVYRYNFWEPREAWLSEARISLDDYGDHVWPLIAEELGLDPADLMGDFAGVDLVGAIADAREIQEHPQWIMENLEDYTNEAGEKILTIVGEVDAVGDSRKKDRWEGSVIEWLGMCGDGFCTTYDEAHLPSNEATPEEQELYDMGLRAVVEGLKESLKKKLKKDLTGQQRLFEDARTFTEKQWVEVAQELLRSKDPWVLDHFAKGIIEQAAIPFSEDGRYNDYYHLVPVSGYLEWKNAPPGDEYKIASHLVGSTDYDDIDRMIDEAREDPDDLYNLWVWTWENSVPEQQMSTPYPEEELG